MVEKIRSELCPGVGLTYLNENRFKSDFFRFIPHAFQK